MTNVASVAAVAALIGDPARAAMLMNLMDGRALTAGELGVAAGVAPSTASGHLGQMLEAGLLKLERQGRHRYYRISSASVAGLLERTMSLAGELRERTRPVTAVRTGPRDAALRRARLCYDHLAGAVAVGVADGMISRGFLDFEQDGGAVTEAGLTFLSSIGVDLASGHFRRSPRAAFCRPCLDWSERRPHIAGVAGRALYQMFSRENWVRASSGGRAVSVTPAGRAGFQRHFGVVLS